MNIYTQKELKGMLHKELKRYEAEIGYISPEERNNLREWVKYGNSPYDNPNCCSCDNGWPMDYVTAIRTDKELRNMHDNPKKYQAEPEPEEWIVDPTVPF